MATTKRIKAAAQASVPQSKEEVARDIKALGDVQRELARATAAMNDQIGAITAQYTGTIEALIARVKTLQKGVQTWCAANREALTNNGKTKTANLVTGEIQWRQRPPSCSVRDVESVLKTLRRLKLRRFIRIKAEVNKEAILNEPDAVRGVAGISIVTGIEDFVITPFEQTVEGA